MKFSISPERQVRRDGGFGSAGSRMSSQSGGTGAQPLAQSCAQPFPPDSGTGAGRGGGGPRGEGLASPGPAFRHHLDRGGWGSGPGKKARGKHEGAHAVPLLLAVPSALCPPLPPLCPRAVGSARALLLLLLRGHGFGHDADSAGPSPGARSRRRGHRAAAPSRRHRGQQRRPACRPAAAPRAPPSPSLLRRAVMWGHQAPCHTTVRLPEAAPQAQATLPAGAPPG